MTKLETSFHIKVSGKYKIEAVSADGTTRLLADWFDNLITNNGLDLMGATANYLQACVVGSGNTTPSFTDTALVAFVAGTDTLISSNQSAQPSTPYFGTVTNTYQFPIGAFPGGANLTEVGISVANDGTNLFSRALILDGIGNPTTISILATEALNVTYQLNQYVPLTDATGTVTVSGTPYGFLSRASDATNVGFWAPNEYGNVMTIQAVNPFTDATIGSITGQISGTELGSADAGTVRATYVPGSYTNLITLSWSLSSANSADGISGFQFTIGVTGGLYQMSISPPIPKDNTKTMTLAFSNSWGRF